jgi:hypothetical protein
VTFPRLSIIAGANGCGKSTLTSRSSFICKTPLLDPDAISKALQPSIPGASAVAAARQVLISAGKHIERRESFAVETTLAGKHYLQMMVDARIRGFEVVLVYIGTENVEINLASNQKSSSHGWPRCPGERCPPALRTKLQEYSYSHKARRPHHTFRQLKRRGLPASRGSRAVWK